MVFRRRRHDDAERPGYDRDDDTGDGEDWSQAEDGEDTGSPEQGDMGDLGTGPWDAEEPYPRAERVDFGSLLVPSRDGFDIRITMIDAAVGIAVDVIQADPVRGNSGLQLQACAAPKSRGLWEDLRQETVEEIAKSGGYCEEVAGPFGPELQAMVGGDAGTGQQLQAHRFLGVDGPRWFLRGVISGRAAQSPEVARPLEDLFSDVVVVRGEHPMPPGELLPLRLPEDATLEQPEPERPSYPNPFERGPEITEIR